MNLFTADDPRFEAFVDRTSQLADRIAETDNKNDLDAVKKLIANFKLKTEDFYRENRKLNIGVVGQVKAGKSSFLNTLLFDGKEILPKASTPKTATLTKMEYSDQNMIQIEYYSVEEWEVLQENASIDSDDEIYTSAKEILGMVRRNGLDPLPYLEKGKDEFSFDTYEDLTAALNNYVGEDGKFTPIIKSVTLYLNKEEFRGLSIVDTPGLNDPIASRTLRTKEFMEVCDVVFFLSQSGSFLDKSDWELLSSQLPQKGVKRLVLIASKYDSGVRDVLREPDEDDIFGDEDDSTASTIPKACKIIRKKLSKRARAKIEEFTEDLRRRESPQALIDVIQQCREPILISAMACNMAHKAVETYTAEERNVYAALCKFSDDIGHDLQLLGNFDEVNQIFSTVVAEKERIFEEKASGFLPTAQEELRTLLQNFQNKSEKRLSILEKNDKKTLLEQKVQMESQMNQVRAEIGTVFGDLLSSLESQKMSAVQEIRELSTNLHQLREHTGEKTTWHSYRVSDSKWYKPWTWNKSHTERYSTTEHYSYCIAADALENIQKYAASASNQVERVFSEALNLKELKRKLLYVIIQNFDMGSEKYDSALFRIMVEDSINQIEFPVFQIDISNSMNHISAKFSGEITSSEQKNALSSALAQAISRIYSDLSSSLLNEVASFKKSMQNLSKKVSDDLLHDISEEFQNLLTQYENKEKEIQKYQAYIKLLHAEIAGL